MSHERVEVTTLWTRGGMEDGCRRCWSCQDYVFAHERHWTCGEILLCGYCFLHLRAQAEEPEGALADAREGAER